MFTKSPLREICPYTRDIIFPGARGLEWILACLDSRHAAAALLLERRFVSFLKWLPPLPILSISLSPSLSQHWSKSFSSSTILHAVVLWKLKVRKEKNILILAHRFHPIKAFVFVSTCKVVRQTYRRVLELSELPYKTLSLLNTVDWIFFLGSYVQ